ncbi:MAG: HAD family hydrolase [Sedimentisphaerales bacterium]|nr:HAD family hydrolase [Sedimentisphaerales bacterium]
MANSLKKYRHLIWDWNGTIIDDVLTCVGVLNSILEYYDKPKVTIEQYRKEFDFPVADYYEKLGIDFSKVSYDVVAEQYISQYNKKQYECTLQSGAMEVLKTISDKDLGQSILSAYNQEMLEEVVKYFGLSDFFDNIVGLSDFYAKSKLDNGRDLIKKLELSGEDVLLIGDTTHDYEVAEQIGSDCALIDDGHQERKRLEATNAIVVNAITDIPDLLI